MRHVRALFALLIACALLGSGFPMGAGSPAAAQDEVSVSGAAVPVTDETGAAVGSITVTEVIDPFADFDPAYPPEEGGRYVGVNVAFDADAGNRFDITPSSIVLQDDAGFLWNQASLVLAEDALIPELSSQTLGPGSRVTGVVGFVVPEGRAPARILYQPESSRIVPLENLSGDDAPAPGDAVTIPDSEGGTGSVTVTDVVDPFEDIDPTQAAPEDGRFVLVALAYENTSDGRFFVEPFGLLLRDANGNLWSATSVTRLEETELIPDISSAQLAPEDRVSGAVVFVVPADTGLAGIYTSPESGQLVQLADLENGADAGPDDTEPADDATADDEATDAEAADAEAADAEAADAEADDASVASAVADSCADLEQWLVGTRERIGRAADMSLEDSTLEDLESLAAHVDEYAALAEDQLADLPPPEAEAAGKALASTFQAYSDSIDQILGASDPGKDVALEMVEGMNTFNGAGTRLREIEEELAQIAAACELT